MPRGRQQAAIVMLPVNFNEIAADFAQQRRRTGLIVQKGAAAAVGLDGAADEQRFAILQHDICLLYTSRCV